MFWVTNGSDMADPKLLVIAAGGTGGHMFPAQALAEEMLSRGWRVKLSTDPRGARYSRSFPNEVTVEVVRSATFARGGVLGKLAAPFLILRGIFTAWRHMRADRPDVVAGFGGYPALPAMAAAILTRTPRLIHEQNAVLGRVNRLFARHVQVVACGMWPTVLPRNVAGTPVGNPVRRAVLARAGAPYAFPPKRKPINILAIGGSQGARILSTVMPQAVALLPAELRKRLHVAQQAREVDAEACERAYAFAGVSAEVSPFFDDLPERMANAQLVVARSGASSVADIAVIGRPSILVPLAIATDDHQAANARGLNDAGAAMVILESELAPEPLAKHITAILTNAEEAEFMAAAALSQGKPDAAQSLAKLVEQLATKEIPA
jgi:UDP-N-acetylglucosamine--N-acetylmuramyl-(pentapeptide) pyrophosphoryl-undecaprenol N-acetylglucosamine transferase